jgi:phage terminase large subunit-like protein
VGGGTTAIGLLLEEFEGALWSRELIEKGRGTPSPCRGAGQVRKANQGEGLSYVRDAESRPHPSAASRLPPASDSDLPVKLVHAGPGKAARAEPVALRFETGRARLAGHFPDLEDQLCALTWSGYQGPGSPDRADAMVWTMTELFEKERPEPRVRRL